MPLVVSGIILSHLPLSARGRSRKKMAPCAPSTGIIFLIMSDIASALNIYMAMSAGPLLIHGVGVRGLFRFAGGGGGNKALRRRR